MASNDSSNTPTPKAPWPTPTGTLTSYNLHCHCGAIRYKIALDPPLYASQIPAGVEQYPVIECHCSHCQRHGGLMVHPLMQNIEFPQGWEELRGVHLSASKKNPHFFCKKCGCFLGTDLTYMMTEVFQGEVRMAINLRMLENCDLTKLRIIESHQMDDMEPQYKI